MKAKIKPSICQGSVKIPPSKSMAHRAIICAALADGKSIISNIDYSVDIQTTIDCMKKLGAHIECFDDYVIVHGIKDFDSIIDNTLSTPSSSTPTISVVLPAFKNPPDEHIRVTLKPWLLSSFTTFVASSSCTMAMISFIEIPPVYLVCFKTV